jgi:glycosyltransferase involved in cell wall biosynthesis
MYYMVLSTATPSSFRIVYIIAQLRRGGAEQQLFYLLKHLPHTATVIVLEKNPQENYWVDPICQLGYEVIELERRGHADFQRLRQVVQLLKSNPADIVHIFNDSRPSFYGRLATILVQVPCVVINERRHPSGDPVWYSRIKRWWLNRHISAFVSNARSSLDYAIEHMGITRDKIYYIPNGLDLQRFQIDPNLDARALVPEEWRDKVIIGSVGSLLPKKAPELFVRVARHVVDACPNARFFHVGKGPLLATLEALRDELGLTDHVQFLGERLDVPQLLQAMDIFLMTSNNEGMPNATMEAMAMWLPCVVTDVGDSREVVHDGETGFVVPVGDEDALTERVLRLINNDALRQTFGERGYTAIQAFSIQAMAECYRDLYQDLLNPLSR